MAGWRVGVVHNQIWPVSLMLTIHSGLWCEAKMQRPQLRMILPVSKVYGWSNQMGSRSAVRMAVRRPITAIISVLVRNRLRPRLAATEQAS
jgi:hypothetical protein